MHVNILDGLISMEKKIIFFDIDGTLYTPEFGGITQIVKDAIASTRKKGHLCFIASGRPYGYIAKNVKEIGFDGYVLANGAVVRYHDENIKVHYLNEYDVQKLCHALHNKNIEYVVHTTDLCYMNENNHCLLEFYKKCNIDFENFCFHYNEEEIFKKTKKIEAWVKTQEEKEYAVSHFDHFAYELHPDGHSMEIYAKDVSKATGILDVLNILNIDKKDSYCFGDGPNDVEMFETVGHAIAMGNAIDVIKEKSDEICLSVQENGVAYKLKELFGE